MTFQDSVRTVLQEKYATFQGRASRSEYWWFALFMWIVYAVLFGLAFGLGFDPYTETFSTMGWVLLVIGGIFALATLVPGIAVAVRRLHDRNMSGWWYLGFMVASAIPFIGFVVSIAMIVLFAMKGTEGENKYGADPLA